MADSRNSFGGQAPSLINDNDEALMPMLARIDSILTELEPKMNTISPSRCSLPSPSCYSRNGTTRWSRRSASRRPYTTEVDSEVERIYRYCDNLDLTLRRLERETNILAGSTNNTSNNQDRARGISFRRNIFDDDADSLIDLSENHRNSTIDVVITSLNNADDRAIDVRSPTRRPFSTRRRSRFDQNTSTRTVRYRSRSPRSVGTSTNNIDVPAKRETRHAEIASKSINNDGSALICPVCMDNCFNRKPTTTKCGHLFCEMCIKRAVLLTGKCPLCNFKLTAKKLIRIYL